jgi:hypothetical protein
MPISLTPSSEYSCARGKTIIFPVLFVSLQISVSLSDGSLGIVCNNGVNYEFQWLLIYLRMINQLKVVQ